MSEDIYKKIAKEVIGEPGALSPLIQRLIDNYNRRAIERYQFIVSSGDKTEETKNRLIEEYKEGFIELADVVTNYKEIKGGLYEKYYDVLKQLSDKNITWGELLSTYIYEDEDYMNEIFVRLVEEQYNVKVTSGKQLWELTVIEDIEPEALKDYEDTFIKAMYYRYNNKLDKLIQEGAKYKDLLKIEPKDYNLPDSWSGCLAKDKKGAILWAIAMEFCVSEPGGLMLLPNLRSIAKELEAPFSIIMEAYNLTNWRDTSNGTTGD